MRVALLLSTLPLSACHPVDAVAWSTFDVDDEGWTIVGDAQPTPELRGQGGNPTGHICATDAETGDFWYFVAPQRYLGNASAAYGKRLVWELKQSSLYNQVKGRDVVLTGGGLSLVFNIRSTPGMDWTPYAAALTPEGGWKRDELGNPAATEEDLRTILKTLTSLRLRGEFVDGPDTACLDNVYFGLP